MLTTVFDKFANVEFPALRKQLDKDFDVRYETFWLETKKKQKTLVSVADKVTPSRVRLDFDLAVCNSLGIYVATDELLDIYRVLVKEIIITEGFAKD